ncbi:hypothetical protein HK098_002242 [Nowakowskiella sp. JEL0407]|nr:hypothetical protein HK098_002242 [Nowakowskiella sp. JEL0407]
MANDVENNFREISKSMYLLDDSVMENVVSIVLENVTRSDGIINSKEINGCVVEAGKDLGLVIAKMKNLWIPRQTAYVEGSVFQINEFKIRIGLVRVGSTSSGILVIAELDNDDSVSSSAKVKTFFKSLFAGIAGTNNIVWDDLKKLNADSNVTDLEMMGLQNEEKFTLCHEAIQILKLIPI